MRQEKIEGCLRHLVRMGSPPSKHISGMLYNAKVKERWYGGGIVYADTSLYQKFASVGAREKGDDDIAALGKLTQDEIGFDACRRMSNFHRDTFT